jgi:hypothetical protein
MFQISLLLCCNFVITIGKGEESVCRSSVSIAIAAQTTRVQLLFLACPYSPYPKTIYICIEL